MPICTPSVTFAVVRQDDVVAAVGTPKVMARGTRRDRSDQLRELATVFFRLMREFEMATTKRLKVSGPLSRLLDHSPEYRAFRGRSQKSDKRVAKEPGFFTLVDAVNEMNVPICALVPSMEHQALTEPQRKVLTLYARWSLANFASSTDERAAYTSDFEDFEAYVTIRKQSDALAASPVDIDSQFEPEDADVLKSIRGISSERLQVTTVRGNSMADRLHDGDRVLIDVHRRTRATGRPSLSIAVTSAGRSAIGAAKGSAVISTRRTRTRSTSAPPTISSSSAPSPGLSMLRSFLASGRVVEGSWMPAWRRTSRKGAGGFDTYNKPFAEEGVCLFYHSGRLANDSRVIR